MSAVDTWCSMWELGEIVGVDLADPGFWDSGLDLVERQLKETEAAAEAVLGQSSSPVWKILRLACHILRSIYHLMPREWMFDSGCCSTRGHVCRHDEDLP